MAVSAPALREALVDVVGREHVLADGRQLEAAAVDGVVPRWVVRARTENDVSRLLALATAERLAVAPRGSGSSQGLGQSSAPTRPRPRSVAARRRDGIRGRGHGGERRGRHDAGRPRSAVVARAPAARPRPVWRRGPDHRRGARLQCERPAALPLRGRARPAARRPLRPGRRDHHVGRLEGREIGDGLRRAQAPGGLARDARRDRGGHAPAPPAAPVERVVALRVRREPGGAGLSRRAPRVTSRARASQRAQRSRRPRMRSAEHGPGDPRLDRERRGGRRGAGRGARRAGPPCRRPRRAARCGRMDERSTRRSTPPSC